MEQGKYPSVCTSSGGWGYILLTLLCLLIPGEQLRIDHLVLVVHGVGSIHEAGFKTLVNCGRYNLRGGRGGDNWACKIKILFLSPFPPGTSVDDFREVAQLMLKTHQFEGQAPRDGDGGGRVEFLPVHWHGPLSGDDATLEGYVCTVCSFPPYLLHHTDFPSPPPPPPSPHLPSPDKSRP